MAAIPSSSINPDFGAAMPCPYLGLRDDPVTHFAWDNPNHHCHRVDPPQPIRVGHQQGYCLSGRFENCPVRNDLNPSPSPSKYRTVFETDGLPIRLRLPHLSAPTFDLDSLRQSHGETESGGKRRVWMLILAGTLVPLVLLLIWVIAMKSSDGGNNQASASSENRPEETLPVAAAIAHTATPSPTPAPSNTPTSQPSNTPTATVDFAATQTVEALTPSPTSTPTQPPYDCFDIRAYTYDLLEGPILSPDPGYVYLPGEPAPLVTASWILENTGSCPWKSILLLSATSGRVLLPLLYVDGELFTPDPDENLVIAGPGEKVEVALNFSSQLASSIQGEWLVVVGDFTLEEQPHLLLKVVNWIIRVQPTATTRLPSRTGPTQPGVTPPSDRPTPTQPSTRP